MDRSRSPNPAAASPARERTGNPPEFPSRSGTAAAAALADERRFRRLILRLVSISELQLLLEEVLESTMGLLEADFGYLQLFNQRTGLPEIFAHRGFRQESLETIRELAHNFGSHDGDGAAAVRAIVEDVEADPSFAPYRSAAAHAGFRALFTSPLADRRGELLGVVSTHFRQPHRPPDADLALTDLYLGVAAELIARQLEKDRAMRREKRLLAIADCSPNPIFFKDAQGHYLFANQALARMLHLDPAECLGKRDEDLFPSNDVAPLRANDLAVLSSGTAREFEERVTQEDGPHTYIVQKFPLPYGTGTLRGVAGIATDVTRLRQAEADLQALLKITSQINSSLDPEELLDSLALETIKLMDAEGGCAGLITPAGLAGQKYFQGSKVVPLEYCWPPLHGLPGWVLVHKKLYLTNDAMRDAQMVRELRERFQVRSAICTPIVDAVGSVVGFFEIHNKREGKPFTEDDAEELMAVSQAAAVAIQNALFYKRILKAEDALLEATSSALVSNLDLPALLDAISTWLCRIASYDDIRLALLGSGNTQLREWVLNPSNPKQPFMESGIQLDRWASSWIVMSGQPLVLNQLETDARPSELLNRLAAQGMRSACWLPLKAGGRVFGMLCFASLREDAFPTGTVDFLVQLAGRIAPAVRNALALRQSSFQEIVGESEALRRTLSQLETVAPTDATVLLLGETGTGKEHFARAIHNFSHRREKRMITVNCAAIPAGLIESELFGHEKGAFTGATARKIGRAELAHEGTLFLDEVGDVPLELQPKLLRLLQEHEFERLGGTQTLSIDTRVVAATNRDLVKMVEDGRFRSDLFYRLNVFPVTVPPLRERPGDIPALVHHFVEKSCQRLNKRIERIPEEILEALSRRRWSGNVRELENVIERAVILSRGPVLEIPAAELAPPEPGSSQEPTPTLLAADRELILRVLRETGGVVGGPGGAAARLGLKRTTLNARMRKLGISRRDFLT